MFPGQVWLVLAIATIMWPNFGTFGCTRQKFVNNYTFEHYRALVDIDTGYAEETKPSLSYKDVYITKQRAKDAILELRRQLLCCYTYNMLYYMNLLELLFSTISERGLADLIVSEDYPAVILQSCSVDTLNVLYHFAMVDEMGPIWLVYMHVKYLRTIVDRPFEGRRRNVLNEHWFVLGRLTDMYEDQNCKIKNRYNDRHAGSDYFDVLETLRSNPEKTRIVAAIKQLGKSMVVRYENLVGIEEHCKFVFAGWHLRLSHIWQEVPTPNMRHLLVDFAEMTDWEKTYAQIYEVAGQKQFNSTRELIANTAKSQSLFTNLVLFTLFHNVYKHLTLIDLSLRQIDEEEQPQVPWPPWASDTESEWKIKVLNESMFSHVKHIIKYFNLKKDSRLARLMYVIELDADVFNIVQNNKTIKEKLFTHMDKIYSKELGCETKLERSSGLVSKQYIADRVELLKNLSENHNIQISGINYGIVFNCTFESVLSTFVLYTFMKNVYFGRYANLDVDFNVIRSFTDFSDRISRTTSH